MTKSTKPVMPFGMLPPLPHKTPAEVEQWAANRKMPTNIYRPVASPKDFMTESPFGAPSIAEQARALKNDADLIYQFVHDNIDYIPQYGFHKGGVGTLIDGCGNAFDQCDLMLQLLTQAGYTCNFVIGTITLSAAQWSNWLNVDQDNPSAATQLLSNGGLGWEWQDPPNSITLNHCWVQVVIDSVTYMFDPAFKQYNYTTGIDIGTAMGYNSSDFLADANEGSTLDLGNYVQGINATNINNDLKTYSMNLAAAIKNMNGATFDQVLGGRAIPSFTGCLRQTTLPYPYTISSTPTLSTIPTDLLATLTASYYQLSGGGYQINQTFNTRDIYSQRLTLWFNGSLQAQLYLNGSPVAGTLSNAWTSGTSQTASISVSHPYEITPTPPPLLPQIWAGQQTTIGNMYGWTSEQMAAVHQQAQNQAIAADTSASAESLLGQSLLLVFDNFAGQSSHGADIIGRLGNTYATLHHMLATVAQYVGSSGAVQYINAFDGLFNISSLVGGDFEAAGFTTALMMEKLEGSASQQVNGVTTADTVNAITLANAASPPVPIYDCNGNNWDTGNNYKNYMTNTVKYPSAAIADVENAITNQGMRVAMPGTANITVGAFSTFYGYMKLNFPSVMGQTWFGAKGAVVAEYGSDSGTNTAASGNARQVNSFGMPAISTTETARVNMLDGRYEYSSEDISVGNQGAPYQLTFKRFYNSALALTLQGIGYGWCHNWQINATANSDGFAGFGYQQVGAAAPVIAALYACLDVVAHDETMPINNFVISCVIQEFLGSQLVNNTVRLQIGPAFQIFTLMPDGTYLPPLGLNRASKLTYNSSSKVYTYTTPEGVVYNFNSNGTINMIVYPFGITITFTYSSGLLSKVSNGFRSLSFTYDTNFQVSTVTDGNGRTVTCSVAAATGNLASVKDPVGNTTTYAYGSLGQLTKIFKPANPTSAIVTNVYDTLGRVKQQTDAYGNVWQYYIAGSRGEEVSPDNPPNGTSRILYFDALGGTLRTINQLGQEVDTQYDGNERAVLITLQEGNSLAFTYDVNGNVLTITQTPKPGSGLSPRTQTFTYDPVWSTQVATVTDAGGNTTVNTYDPSTGLLLQTQYPNVPAGTPIAEASYNSIGQLVTATDPTGIQTSYTYDSVANNMLTQSVGSGSLILKTTFGYDVIGNVTSMVDRRQNIAFAATFTYDNNRRCTQISRPGNSGQTLVCTSTYDANGNLIQAQQQTPSDPAYQLATIQYSIDDKPLVAVAPPNNVQGATPQPVTYSYDVMRRVSSVVDQQGIITSYSYDFLSRITAITRAGITLRTNAYSLNGLLESVTDTALNTTSVAFDGFDRSVMTTFADGSPAQVTEQASYDVLDRVTQIITRNNVTITQTYDALGQIVTSSPQGLPTVSFTYDLVGRLLTASTPSVTNDPSTGTFTFLYDSVGRLTGEQTPDDLTVSYQLDGMGNVVQTNYPVSGPVINRKYDAANRLVSLSEPDGPSATFGYDTASRVNALAYGNQTGTGYRYDKNSNIMAVTFGGAQLNTGLQVPQVDFSLTVNQWNTRSKRQCSDDQSFIWYPQASSTINYAAANELNQYPSVNGVDFTYDENGCLTNDGTLTYGYDALSRLVSVTGDGVNVVYEYDPTGRLTLKTSGSTVTRYLYAGLRRIAELDGSGNLIRRYVYGAGLDTYLYTVDNEGVVTYLYADESNSLVMMADAEGVPTSTRIYDPWGNLASGEFDGINIGYAGQFFEPEIGCYYNKARFYSPALGRFLQPDPSGYASGLNSYEYGGSNPVNFADPLGLQGFALTATQSQYTGIGNTSDQIADYAGLPGYVNTGGGGGGGGVPGFGVVGGGIGGGGGNSLTELAWDYLVANILYYQRLQQVANQPPANQGPPPPAAWTSRSTLPNDWQFFVSFKPVDHSPFYHASIVGYASGGQWFDVSAGPQYPLPPNFGRLTYRSSQAAQFDDFAEQMLYGKQVQIDLKGKMTAQQFMALARHIASQYESNVRYAPLFPNPGNGTANSNSFVSGVLNRMHITPPQPPSFIGPMREIAPGYNSPVFWNVDWGLV